MRCAVVLGVLLFGSALVIAATTAQLSRAADEATRVEIDQKSGVIRFVIDGQERAVLDAVGLHVNGNLEFTGQTIDIGDWSKSGAGDAP